MRLLLGLICASCTAPTSHPGIPSADSSPSLADTSTPKEVVDEAAEWATPAEAVDVDEDPGVVHVELTARPHQWTAGERVVDGFAYNGQVPGPTIRATVGDTLVVDFTNETELSTSVHWHGLSVPYAMDGAGWMVDPVEPQGTFRYTFVLEQAGTFWYHPHFDTARSVDLGLYGVVVVEDPDDPAVDLDQVVVFDSVGEDEAGPDHHGVKASPLEWLVNGVVRPTWRPRAGASARLRLVNASNQGYVALDAVRVIGGDQGLLPEESDRVVLSPGDRAELLWEVGRDRVAVMGERWSLAGPGPGEPLPLFELVPSGSAPAASVSWPSRPVAPTPDPGRTDLRYVFTGSAENGWEINGQTFPSIAPDEVALGSEVILEIRNPSPSHHPFHLHGMVFEVLSVDGVAPPVRRIEDTLDIAVRQTVRLRIEADNPGDWMSHCHILPHAERGMMTVLSVR